MMKVLKLIYKHLEWGIRNGLEKKDIQILEKKEVENIEPNIKLPNCNIM